MEIILKNKKRVGSFPVNKNISFADGYRTVAPKLKYHKKNILNKKTSAKSKTTILLSLIKTALKSRVVKKLFCGIINNGIKEKGAKNK